MSLHTESYSTVIGFHYCTETERNLQLISWKLCNSGSYSMCRRQLAHGFEVKADSTSGIPVNKRYSSKLWATFDKGSQVGAAHEVNQQRCGVHCGPHLR